MDPLIELLGESPAIESARETIRRLLARQHGIRRPPAVLLEGETGTGKGLVAKLIHQVGPRSAKAFVSVNCAAIPDTLLESELFGHERGAFTDARRARAGLFQTAHQGTLFLDEVGLLPEALQAKLLTVIEERAVRRLGGTHPEPADAWIISATNSDLLTAIRERRFREDLYHRLAVVTLRLPPLRERGRDVILLAQHLLGRVCADYGLPPKGLSREAEDLLLAHSWPGNVRELNNVLERVALLTDGPVVTADVLELPGPTREEPAPPSVGPARAPTSADDALREHLERTLVQTGWNISRTAEQLRITRNTVRAWIEKLGLTPAPRPAGRRYRAVAPAPPEASEPRPAAPALALPATPPQGPNAIRWESRRVTLLRAALVAADGESPDKGRALDVLLDKLQSFGARIDELSPTTVGALFGLEPVEDAQRRAAHAAMAIQNAAARGRGPDGEPFGVKIGIHVGEVLVGYFSGDLQIDAPAKRAEWQTLDPLVERASAHRIVVSEAAKDFLARRFDLDRDESGPSPVYYLRGRERRGLAPEKDMVGFVGRRQELALLNSRLHSARAGRGQVVGIVGEAGIGKSRLLYEFRQALRGESVTYLEGHCLSYGTTIPHFPVQQILRGACLIREADGPVEVTAKLRKSLQRLEIDPESALPYLLRFLDVREGTDTLEASTPDAIQARTTQILRQMCISASRRRPLIIALEDAHWLDAASEALAALVGSLEGMPVLLIVTYRPGYWPLWLERSHITQIALQPLSPEHSLTLLGGFLPDGGLSDPVRQLIVSRAEGNPFFLEELARTVREQSGPADAITVPDTVEEVLRARINRLSAHERRLLQSAAVIGKTVMVDVLSVLADLRESELRAVLDRLRAADFLYELDLEGQYSFKHALTHEVAYGSIAAPERRDLHARIVVAIESIHAERLTEHVERLALHSTKGEQWDKAVAYLHLAGIKAAERFSHRQAAVSFEQALEILRRLPRRRETVQRAIDLRLDLRNSLQALGELERILEYLREAETLAASLDDSRRLGQIFALMTQTYRMTGQPDQAIESGEKALDIARWQPNSLLWLVANLYLGAAHSTVGNYRKAAEILTRTIRSLPDQPMHQNWSMNGLPPVFTRSYLVYCLAEMGEFEEARIHAEEAGRSAKAAGQSYSVVFACGAAGTRLLVKGEIEQATAVLEEGLTLARTLNLAIALPLLATSLGQAYTLQGHSAEAILLLEEAIEHARSMKRAGGHALLLVRLGDAYRLAGRPTDAGVIGRHALELARTHKERGHEAYALRSLADLAAQGHAGGDQEAESLYRQALVLAEELGMRPLGAHCRWHLARVLVRSGRTDEAAAALSAAVAAFRALDMPYWVGRAEADLRGLPTPA